MKATANENQRPIPLFAESAALVFALVFPTLATWLYFIALSGQPAMQPAYAATKVLQFCFPVVWVVAVQRRRLRVRAPGREGVALGLLFGLVVMGATLGLYYGYFKTSPVLASAPAAVAEKIAGFGVHTPLAFAGLAAFIALVHSLLEEYYWRWFVFGELARHVPLRSAVALASLGFMAHHVLVIGQFLEGYGPFTWFFSLCVAVGGAAWAWLYHRTQALYAPWLSHLLVDAGLMWIGYDLWRLA